MRSPHDIDYFFEGIERIKQSLKWKIKLILGLNEGGWKNYINFHFESLTYHYGKTQNYYDEIYDINDLDQKVKPYLENLWKIDLPNAKMRNSKVVKLNYLESLNNRNIKQIINFYKEDYQNGWAKVIDF